MKPSLVSCVGLFLGGVSVGVGLTLVARSLSSGLDAWVFMFIGFIGAFLAAN
jgi:hypothetical protein